MYEGIKKILFDKAVMTVLASRLFNSMAGVVTIYFIFRSLSISDQAHYYTFINLVGFSVFFEFGISTLIIQYVSHHMANIEYKNSELNGSLKALDDLHFFICNTLYLAILLSIIIWTLMTLLGIFVFRNAPELYVAWFVLTFLTSINFLLNTMLNIIEGTGRLIDVARIRLFLMIFSVPVLWFGLWVGFGVHSLSAQLVASIFFLSCWLYKYYSGFFEASLRERARVKIFNFFKSIFPLQSKLSFSFLSTYMSSQAFVPIIFAMGYVDFSARLGASLQILNAINGFAITWINSKLAIFGAHVARDRLPQLKTEFGKLFFTSILVLVTLLIIFWLVIFFMSAKGSIYVGRMLPINFMLLLSVAAIANHFYAALNIYLLSFKKDPLFNLNLIRLVFLLAGFSLLFYLRFESGFIYLFLISSVFISMSGSLYTFNRFNRTYNMRLREFE